MGGLKVEFHYQVLSIILYEKNSKNINSVLIRKFCLVNSIQLLTQKLKTCSRLYCCFLGKNTFLGLVGSHRNSSLFKVAFKAVSFHDKANFLEKYFHDIIIFGKSAQ